MLSQSPPVTVHFQFIAAPGSVVQRVPSISSRLSRAGNGWVTMGSVGQLTSTLHEQSRVRLFSSKPSQSKSPLAQTSSAYGGCAPRHSASHTAAPNSLPVETHFWLPTELVAPQPTGSLVLGSACDDEASEHARVVPTGCSASHAHPSSTWP